ncbi:hypothetical protein P175DRAFT_0478668 [Aspergillus ochraceoroseus IBT 24754]|uniref:Apurinic-apyrimidinic endonuclease 1 n=1 Tax=Aspergillus ochraceoroseus IBT 24754 TaxID=1392256 RepID=A0A2T5LWI0_9EURO|nr:uncharacterized protein P175DRAFT_0478668 [Aspergillus ochraceoroseus IBT 24754]PTU20636.1 hypothetical protein P175DRAFT_0478668 [Aspergillus ochraceoroseus IBT 24754]
MPPRGPRNVIRTPTVATSDNTSADGHKRKLDNHSDASLQLRRSKRVKSTEPLYANVSDPELEPTDDDSVQVKRASSSIRQKSEGLVDGTTKSVKEDIAEEKQISIKPKVEEIEAQPKSSKKTATKVKSKNQDQASVMPLRVRTPGLRMCVGAHVSAAGGVFNAVNNSVHVGGNAFALFLKSQRKWNNPPLQDEHRDTFRKLCAEHNYDAARVVLPHGSYLVNLAQADKAKSKQAYDSFLDDLHRCEALGIKLYNFHPGSANQSPFPDALSRLAKALTNALAATSTVVPVLETMCGHGSTIGGSLTEFRDLLALIPKEYHSRIGICIDTCHSFAAGYDLAAPCGFQAFMKEFEDVIGIQHLRALHLNDSKAPQGSKRDLHANIGTGFLGLRAFHNVMNEPRFEGLPMILETPIDRPASTTSKTPKGEDASDAETKPKKTTQKKPAAAKNQLVQDFSVWANEIELLESLIGMDPESPEFLELEAKLAEEGREMRESQMAQYKRKLETAEKKKTKSPRKKGQKTLMEMMGDNNKKKQNPVDDSEDEGCQSCSGGN